MPRALSSWALNASPSGNCTAFLDSVFLCQITLFLSLTVANRIDGIVKLWGLSLLSLLHTSWVLIASKWQLSVFKLYFHLKISVSIYVEFILCINAGRCTSYWEASIAVVLMAMHISSS